jgi:hypothetical protein
MEPSDEDGGSFGKCPDLITGIHGDDPVRLDADLATVVEEVIAHFEQEERPLPPVCVRPMQVGG